MNKRYRASKDPKICEAALQKAAEPMVMTDQVLTWCLVHGALQLAMRHPQFGSTISPVSYQRIQGFIASLGNALVDAGFLTPEILAESVRREEEFNVFKPPHP